MALTPGLGSVYLYTVNMLKAGQRMQMSTFLTPNATPGTSDYITWCASFLNNMNGEASPFGALVSICPIAVSFVSHSIQAIAPTRLVKHQVNIVGDLVNGTLGGLDATPVNSAASWSRYSEDGTRHGRGSQHPPAGVMSLLTTASTWTGGFKTQMEAVATQWIQAFPGPAGGPSMQPILWNKANPTRLQRLIGIICNPYVRTMRRRTVGLGI